MGDTILLIIQGETKTLTVSGIYSDITNGGKTAKAAFSDDSTESMWNVFYGSLSKQSEVEKRLQSIQIASILPRFQALMNIFIKHLERPSAL